MELRCLIRLLAALFLLSSVPVRADSIQVDYPPFVQVVGQQADPDELCASLNDSTFEAIAASTVFIVNKWGLRPNDPTVRLLEDDILPRLREEGMELIGICMRGAASPEGPYDNNVMLSQNRARSLARFVTDRLGQLTYDINDICTRTQAEDYPYLVLVMRRNQDPDTEEVAAIVDQCGGDERLTKQKLQKAQGGRLWARLLKEYYPNLRAARMVMFFRRARDLEPLALNPAYTPATPEILSPSQAIILNHLPLTPNTLLERPMPSQSAPTSSTTPSISPTTAGPRRPT